MQEPAPQNLIVKIDGTDIDNGIDVFELAPSLLSLAIIIKESNRTIHGTSAREITINVKPFREGSFVEEIFIFAKNNAQQAIDYVNKDGVKQLKETIEWIGLAKPIVVGAITTPLIGLIKWLKGKPPQSIAQEEGKIYYTNKDGTRIEVTPQVHSLYSNIIIHQNFYDAFGKPLEAPGRKYIKTYPKDHVELGQEITQDDLSSISGYTNQPLIIDVDEEKDQEYEWFLNFKRGSYEGDPTHWSFRRGDQTIIASITDETFLQKIQSGEVRPYAQDLLRVKIIEKQRIKGQNVLPPTYQIIKVIEYKPAPINQKFI